MDIKEFYTDEKLEEDGTWVDCGDGLELLVTRLFNDRFTRLMAAKRKPLGRRVDRDPKLAQDILVAVMAECILLDWKGLKDGDKPIKFSKATALDLMARSRDFRNLVTTCADDAANFHAEEQEADRKN